MKGITPIISIIILLLITIGMAAAAWTYLGGYMDSLTGKNIAITYSSCISDASQQRVLGIIHNMGKSKILVGANSEILIVSDETGNSVPVADIDWTKQGDSTTAITEIGAGSYGQVLIDCCTTGAGATCPKRCTYKLLLAGRAYELSAQCSG